MTKLEPAGYFLYFIECDNGSIYTGTSQDVHFRFKKHEAGTGSTWTKNNAPVRIIAVRTYPSRTEAYGQERKLKKYSRSKKVNWIMANCHYDVEALSILKEKDN